MDEEAKAVQEVAKTSGKAVDLFCGIGAFLKDAVGPLIVDSVGFYADKVRARRLEQAVILKFKILKNLRKLDITVPPSAITYEDKGLAVEIRSAEEAKVIERSSRHQ
jgi:hypothetical protein